jgi:hypothetical protein
MKLFPLAAAVVLLSGLARVARAEDDESQETQEAAPQPAGGGASASEAPDAAADAGSSDADGRRHAMTDAEKIDWYCRTHADEGAGCRAHALQLLPYISDYAQYDDSDTRGQTLRRDPSGCDFSPLPPGCPGASSGGGGTSSGGPTGAGGGGGSLSGGPLTGGVGTLSGGPLTGAGGSSGKKKVVAFPTWSSAAPIRDPNTGRVIFNWNSYGPGTIVSMGFKPDGTTGMWSWVQNINSTDGCTYKGWISLTPGGAQVPNGVGCNPTTTNYNGGNRIWKSSTDKEIAAGGNLSAMWCLLKPGQRYYFNLLLTEWRPNPNDDNIYSCIEYVVPQGQLGSYYKE